MSVYTIFISLTVLFQLQVNSLNILGVFPYPGKSHFFAYEPLLKELAKKGHTVTVISYFPQEVPTANYNDISLAGKLENYEKLFSFSSPSYLKIIYVGLYLIQSGISDCKTLLSDKNVQDLWKNEKKIDVVIVEQFNSDCALGLAFKLNAPVVGLTSYTLMPYHYNRYGIPNNPSYTPLHLLNGGSKPSLTQRIERAIFTIYFQYFVRTLTQKIDQYTLSQYFENVPSLEELGFNIKFLLLYDYFVFPAPSVISTNVIQVGGYHVPEPKGLPEVKLIIILIFSGLSCRGPEELVDPDVSTMLVLVIFGGCNGVKVGDVLHTVHRHDHGPRQLSPENELKKFCDESKHGVIIVSFGTMINSSSITHEKLEAVINTVRELKQRVIWKWDPNALPDDLAHVYVSKWIPQNDILAHPKVIAFFSHCGMLGLTEAIHHGVPVVGMPVFGDQPYNAAAIEESGMGVQIQFDDLTKDKLLEKFRTVIDRKFRENVKRISKMWHDRPISAKESAVFWIEYTARHHNVTFRTASADVPLYQYLCLDVIATLSIFFIGLFYVIKFLTCLSFNKKVKKNKFKKPKLP